jgi:class 3 adenylate cyclase
MNCETCGAQILAGRKFCTECGTPVTEAPLSTACATCGASNPMGAKFCGDCGRAFEPAAATARRSLDATFYEVESNRQTPDAQRRQLTVQFCDLVGSTELSTRLDPENLRDIISAYHRSVADTVARFDGYIARYMGDGVLVYFGYPQAHEDDAERAVRAALALVEVVGTIEAPEQLRVRVGIATGPVVVGDLIGSGEAQQRQVVGETPNLAARLQALAKPGEVVIAPSTRRLLGNLFEYRNLGAVDLKGFAAPVSAWQVLREGAAEGRFEAFRSTEALTPLVGREAEIALLLDRWRSAQRGAGQVALIAAEPGIGKSRLVTALMQESLQAESPYTRLRYFCSPHHTDSAFYPIVAQFERAAGFMRTDAPAEKLAKLEALLAVASEPAEDVALIAELLSVSTDVRYPPLSLSPQRKREKTLEALLRLIAALARQQPLLMVFEDTHWIDPSSRELLQLIVEQVMRLPVLLLITFRHVTTLALRRLDRGEGAAIVERIAHGKALPIEIMEQIAAKTDGVPLFVEELTKMILESGLLGGSGRPLRVGWATAAASDPGNVAGQFDGASRPIGVGQGSGADRRRDRPGVFVRSAGGGRDSPRNRSAESIGPTRQRGTHISQRRCPASELRIQTRAGAGRGLSEPVAQHTDATPHPHRRRARGTVPGDDGSRARVPSPPLHPGELDRQSGRLPAESRHAGDRTFRRGRGHVAVREGAGANAKPAHRSRKGTAGACPAGRVGGGAGRRARIPNAGSQQNPRSST